MLLKIEYAQSIYYNVHTNQWLHHMTEMNIVHWLIANNSSSANEYSEVDTEMLGSVPMSCSEVHTKMLGPNNIRWFPGVIKRSQLMISVNATHQVTGGPSHLTVQFHLHTLCTVIATKHNSYECNYWKLDNTSAVLHGVIV